MEKKIYEVGCKKFDLGHKDFFRLLLTFEHTPTSLFFERLENHLINHFEDEKKMMIQSRYWGLEEHVKSHEEFIAILKKTKHYRFEQINDFVKNDLIKWFDEHWEQYDKSTGLYLRRATQIKELIK